MEFGNFFKDGNNGDKSFIRLASGFVIGFALLWGTFEIIANVCIEKFDIHEELILGTITLGLTGKVFQKRYEIKPPVKNEESEST